jgi:hypothetical protein
MISYVTITILAIAFFVALHKWWTEKLARELADFQLEQKRQALEFAQSIINGQADTILELERERLVLGDEIGPCF